MLSKTVVLTGRSKNLCFAAPSERLQRTSGKKIEKKIRFFLERHCRQYPWTWTLRDPENQKVLEKIFPHGSVSRRETKREHLFEDFFGFSGPPTPATVHGFGAPNNDHGVVGCHAQLLCLPSKARLSDAHYQRRLTKSMLSHPHACLG